MRSRRTKRATAVHAVTGTVMGALAFFVPVKHALAHRGSSHHAKLSNTHCDSLAHVGDSLTWQAKVALGQQYVRRGWVDARVDAKGGRGIASFMYDDMTGLDAVRKIKATGFDGCWVMALGTNDTANTDVLLHDPRQQHAWRLGLIRAMMNELDGAPVVWINTHLPDPDIEYSTADAEAWNAALQEVLPEYPNMQIFDWDSVAKDHPEWTKADMVHDTPEGSAKRAQIVSRAVTMMLKGNPPPADVDRVPSDAWPRPFRGLFRHNWPTDFPGP